jgi:hypothetical protein
MSWNRAFDHAADYWQDLVPDISNVCIKHTDKPDTPLNISLNSDDVFPEPRSLEGSELSLSSEEITTNVWTTEEDASLVEKAEKSGFEWEEVAKSFQNVSAKQVEHRWKKIRKNDSKTEFNDEQDKLILSLYKTYGGNWKKISTFFDGVSPNVIKNRFYTELQHKVQGSEEVKTEEKRKIVIPETKKDEDIRNLSDAEKKKKLIELYQKVMNIEKYINKTKSQIQIMVSKGATK